MIIQFFSKDGVNSTVAVSDDIFAIEEAIKAVHKSLHVNAVNDRYNIASTLTKGEVRGGGRKPFRQKGTGNGRQGSITNPHYVGGGVAFGPKPVKNYTRKMPIKEKRLALFSALSMVAKEGKLLSVEFPETIKNLAEAKSFLKNLPTSRSVLIYDLPYSPLARVLRNLEGVTVKPVTSVKVKDLLLNEQVCFTKAALEKFESAYVTK